MPSCNAGIPDSPEAGSRFINDPNNGGGTAASLNTLATHDPNNPGGSTWV